MNGNNLASQLVGMSVNNVLLTFQKIFELKRKQSHREAKNVNIHFAKVKACSKLLIRSYLLIVTMKDCAPMKMNRLSYRRKSGWVYYETSVAKAFTVCSK